jgi:uncharacterized iron-regulated membrane protein
MNIRSIFVLLHRYVGLTMTAFLVIVGLTGSLLAFHDELEKAINPQLFVSNPAVVTRDPATLLRDAERIAPQAKSDGVWIKSGVAYISVSPRETANNTSLNFDQLILNAEDGHELGRRNYGDISQGRINIMPFIYQLHYSLALDETGSTLLGIVALIWTLDCFVGFYLTLPMSQNRISVIDISGMYYTQRPFWQRWKIAWKIKWSGSAQRLNFDLHRASGLWVWIALFIFAWSSVYMNLGDSVYRKVTQTLFELHEPWSEFPSLEKPIISPAVDWETAQRVAQKAIDQAVENQHFTLQAPVAMWLNREKGFYVYNVRSSLDFQDKAGQTRIVVDAMTAEVKLILLPQGQYSGNTVTAWLVALHTANVFGLPYRFFVCFFGLIIVMLCVTGVVIWLKKRRSYYFHRSRF